MNQRLIDLIREKCEEIMKISYPLCKNESDDIALINNKINNLAYEIKETLKKIKFKD